MEFKHLGLRGATAALLISGVLALTAAQRAECAEITDLHTFTSTANGGFEPRAGLALGADGSFFGTTYLGGANNDGVIFRTTPQGITTTFVSLVSTTGIYPNALLLASDGNFYGTAFEGGVAEGCFCGSVLKVTPAGKLSAVVVFNRTNGAYPESSLVQAGDGNLYGTTQGGGANGAGTIFRLSLQGNLTTIYSFPAPPGGGEGQASGLIVGSDGNLYGTTGIGGGTGCNGAGCGTFFRITLQGVYTTLASFTDLQGPLGPTGVMQASDGNFYGMSASGGAATTCSSSDGVTGCGTIYQVTTAGVITTIYSFSPTFVGTNPLIQGADGLLYASLPDGGSTRNGSVISVTLQGDVTTLAEFDNTNGEAPYGALLQTASGTLYGTTYYGGTCKTTNCGVSTPGGAGPLGTVYGITP